MGNCMRHNNGLTITENLKPISSMEEGKTSGGEEESERSREGESKVVRIKVMVTKEELRQIVSNKNGVNSVQHLVHVLKDSGRNIYRANEIEEEEEKELSDDEHWRPSLESIPENH